MSSLLVVLLILLFVPGLPEAANKEELQRIYWQFRDMDPKLLEVYLDPESPDCSHEQCTFGLHYYTSPGFNPKRGTILFVPGGPGQIVDPQYRELSFLEQDYNVVYFDVRGTGQSLVSTSSVYDKYLRARYVVEDIEALRKHLKIERWHAIYGHSWGTIVAQLYAAKYGKSDPKSHGLVENLILSAPVARGKNVTENERNQMLISNLIDIYKHYRSRSDQCFEKVWKTSEVDFCFLRTEQIEQITSELNRILDTLREYGSLAFVGSHYPKLAKDVSFKKLFPYPAEFYRAIQRLQFLGGVILTGANDLDRHQKGEIALYLGYYLTIPFNAWSDPTHALYPFKDEKQGCQFGAPLLSGVPDSLQTMLCAQVNFAELSLGKRQFAESLRARTVFAIYDGLNRWTFELLGKKSRLDENDCFTGRDLQDLANGYFGTNETLNAEAGRIGVNPLEKICPWTPSRYAHGVRTLLLRGKADPVVAGGQPEEILQIALTGERTLVEFPGVGHHLTLPTTTVGTREISASDALRKLISAFLRGPATEHAFGADIMNRAVELELYGILARLQVEVQTVHGR